jgi:GNAT superfamily N-acetyltransferase
MPAISKVAKVPFCTMQGADRRIIYGARGIKNREVDFRPCAGMPLRYPRRMPLEITPMPAAHFGRFRNRHLAAQAPDFSRSFGLSETEARAIAEKELARMLPDGVATTGQALFDVNGEAGHLWLTERELMGKRSLFIADVFVSEESRGQGIGKLVLHWVEDEARRRGLPEVTLHVFGANAGARKLYEACGYLPTSVQMGKKI